MGLWVWGLRFGVYGLGFRVWVLWLRVLKDGYIVQIYIHIYIYVYIYICIEDAWAILVSSFRMHTGAEKFCLYPFLGVLQGFMVYWLGLR